MTDYKLNKPVAFLIFKRPKTTEKVFEVIRQVKPPTLLVVADGARLDRPGEAEQCAAARKIIDRVDWDCQVLKNYSDKNLGCMQRVSSGLDWVFEKVDEAIILEDDCCPDATFFQFCEQLLDCYKNDERIMTVCGVNFQFGRSVNAYSYYYSLFHDCWGWATWKRAWKYYDIEMKLWPQLRDSTFLEDKFLNSRAANYWRNNFQSAYEKKVDSWFYRWLFSCWVQSGLGIFFQSNLVSNIGVGKDGTNTLSSDGWEYSNMPIKSLNFPLKHPLYMFSDRQADKFTQETRFRPNLISRVQKKLNKFFR